MTLNEFIEKWLGKKADYDGSYGGQCVDLFRFFVKEVLGYSQPKGVTGAADFWTNYESDQSLKNNFIKILNTPDGLPQAGDVMLWNKKAGGGFGHVSIFLDGNLNSFTSLDQNWPTLSKVTKTTHDYSNVLGWLRSKKSVETTEETMSILYDYLGVKNDDEAKTKLKEHLGEDGGKCDWGNSESNRGGHLGSARRKITKLEGDLKAQAEYAGTLETQVETIQAENDSLESAKEVAEGKIKTANGQIKVLEGQVKSLQDQMANQVQPDPSTDSEKPAENPDQVIPIETSNLIADLLKTLKKLWENL